MTDARTSAWLDSPEPVEGSYFVSAYPPFSCWSETEVGAFLRALDRSPGPAGEAPPLGLYVHIPFCVERCQYCYYLSYDDRSSDMDPYSDALIDELALYAGLPALAGRALSFVYFGGGTPSLLSIPRLRRLISGLQALFSWSGAREVTFECAPKSVTEGKLAALRRAGVTRISLGVQELDDGVLRRNGRVHLVRDVVRAYEAIRRVGFPVTNLDLIVGLVGETDGSFRDSLEHVMSLGPESVTIYQLEIPLNTPLYRALRDGTLHEAPASWAVKRARLGQGFARLEEAGYTVRSAYSAVRDPVRHRFVYQEEQYRGADLLGIGASAFSYLAGFHQQNRASLGRYVEPLAEGRLPLGRARGLSDDERLVREFVLQLKLGRVDAAPFRRKFGVEIARHFAGPLAPLADRGWLRVKRDAVELTREGLLLVDRLLPAFYLPGHRGIRYS